MNNLSLKELITQLETELHRLHYKESTVKYYRSMWRRIITFFENEGVNQFTEEVGMLFLEKQYNFFELEKEEKLTQSIINAFKVVRILGGTPSFQNKNCIL